MRYFFSKAGDYLGAFDEGSLGLVPEDAIEWPNPPSHGFDKLVNGVIVPYQPQEPLIDQLKAIFASVPLETQAQLGPLAASVFLFVSQDNPQAAKLVIQGATVPPELEALQSQMLGLFDD